MTTEKIAKPIINTQIPAEEKEPTEERVPIKTVEESPARQEKNTIVPELKRLKSGEHWEWEWLGPAQDDPLFQVARDALNIASTNYEDLNSIAEIGKMAITMVGDTPETLYKFLRQELSHIPSNGDPIVSLRRNMEILYNSLLNGGE